MELAIKLSLDLCFHELKTRVSHPVLNTLCSEQENQEKKLNFLFGSECPGWTCYAEKKEGDFSIPYMSQIKSPQQLQGNILKTILSKHFSIDLANINHVSIMPCYDKKLEAARDPNNLISSYKETDTVISTIELIELFSKLNIEFDSASKSTEISNTSFIFSPLEKFIATLAKNNCFSIEEYNKLKPELTERDYQVFFEGEEYFSSNSYSEYFIKKVISGLMETGSYTNDFKIERKVLRNTDMREINLYYADRVVFKIAVMYGFRNIQYIMKNIKSKKDKFEYSFVEVMACPGGCLNGGGQMRPSDENETSKDLLKRVEADLKGYISGVKSLNEDEYNHIREIIGTYVEKGFSHIEYKAVDKDLLLHSNLNW